MAERPKYKEMYLREKRERENLEDVLEKVHENASRRSARRQTRRTTPSRTQ